MHEKEKREEEKGWREGCPRVPHLIVFLMKRFDSGGALNVSFIQTSDNENQSSKFSGFSSFSLLQWITSTSLADQTKYSVLQTFQYQNSFRDDNPEMWRTVLFPQTSACNSLAPYNSLNPSPPPPGPEDRQRQIQFFFSLFLGRLRCSGHQSLLVLLPSLHLSLSSAALPFLCKG